MGTYWEDKVKQKHVYKLSSIKPSIDNKPPATYPHLQNKSAGQENRGIQVFLLHEFH